MSFLDFMKEIIPNTKAKIAGIKANLYNGKMAKIIAKTEQIKAKIKVAFLIV